MTSTTQPLMFLSMTTFSLLQQLCGQTVVLANPKIRKCDRSEYGECNFEPLVLANHQMILETSSRSGLKEEVCMFFTAKGHMVVPSDQDKQYLTQGCMKLVPTQLFVECLLHLHISFAGHKLWAEGERGKICYIQAQHYELYRGTEWVPTQLLGHFILH